MPDYGCAEWMRIGLTTFLSSEAIALAAIRDPRELKAYFFDRFKGTLDLVIKSVDKTNSPLASWAKESLEEAWNVRLDG